MFLPVLRATSSAMWCMSRDKFVEKSINRGHDLCLTFYYDAMHIPKEGGNGRERWDRGRRNRGWGKMGLG